MSDQQLEPVVRTWLEATDRPPSDGRRSTGQIMARLPERTKRRGWWPNRHQTSGSQVSPIPAASHQYPATTGRTRSMFSPAKAITAGAVVFALGGLLLIAQPLDRQSDRMTGSSTAAEAAPPVEFTARWAYGPDKRAATTETIDGVAMERGGAWEMTPVAQASDPRLRGTLSRAANFDDYSAAGGPTVWNYAFRIENDEGSWQQVPTIGLWIGLDDPTSTTGVLVGEGGYAGLIAVFENEQTGVLSNLHGYIIDGDLTAAPDPYVTE